METKEILKTAEINTSIARKIKLVQKKKRGCLTTIKIQRDCLKGCWRTGHLYTKKNSRR